MLEEIRRRLTGYAPRSVDNGGHARAAILIPVFLRDGELHVVLTKRTETVRSHKGEICFPGGAMEPVDAGLAATALRESEEEIGLRPADVEIIGRVDDLITVSDFHVSAYVGFINPDATPYTWTVQTDEVAEILEVPIAHLLDEGNRVEIVRNRGGQTVLLEGVKFHDHVIWGATQRMLRNFLDVAVVTQAVSAAVEAIVEEQAASSA